MNKKVLLTGRPGCGKTTLIKSVVRRLPRGADGFYTEEIRVSGTRAGFKIVTLNGDEVVFAHVGFETRERVGKYGLNLPALEAVGVKAVLEAVHAQKLVVIDEIGPMEIRSRMFREAVSVALDSGGPVLATIFARPIPFTDVIKSRPDVVLIEVRPDNRDRLISELLTGISAVDVGS